MSRNTFLIDLAGSDRTDFGRVPFAAQAHSQKVFSAVWALESQVNDGGFPQYFASWDGDTAEFAPLALREIGAERCADIVERALRAVSPEPLPAAKEEREALLHAIGDDGMARLEALDAEFLAYPDDLTELLFAFVMRHPDSFGLR